MSDLDKLSGLKDKFQMAYAAQGTTDFILAAVLCDDKSVKLPDELASHGRILHHFGDGTLSVSESRNAAFVLVGMSKKTNKTITAFAGLAKEAGATFLGLSIYGLWVNKAGDPAVLWSIFLFEFLRGSAFIDKFNGYMVIQNPFAASVEAIKKLIGCMTIQNPAASAEEIKKLIAQAQNLWSAVIWPPKGWEGGASELEYHDPAVEPLPFSPGGPVSPPEATKRLDHTFTLTEFAAWLDTQLLVLASLEKKHLTCPGQSVRNAFRLLEHLGLRGAPSEQHEPVNGWTVHAEIIELERILHWCRESDAPAGAASGEAALWLTLSEAARISGINKGMLSRAVSSGKLKSNGATGRARRIDAGDFTRFQLERAKQPEATESNEQVERLTKKHFRH